jgi:HAD superfamily hydrolase (TIGR01509 family)
VIKAILFDYDGVLTTHKTGTLTTNSYLSKASGLKYDTVSEAFSSYNSDLNIGKTTYREIWADVCESVGYSLNFSLLEEAFLSTPMNDDMFELARRLKPNYSVGIITDNKKDRIDCLREAQNLDELFDPIVVSAERGVGKQSPLIFEFALDYLQAKPEETVFIDNTSENLLTARRLGMHAILHDDEKNDVRGLIATLNENFGFQLGSQN